MKKNNIILIITIFLFSTFVAYSASKSKGVTGTYDQVAITKPSSVKISAKNVTVTGDSKESKKIWVKNLLPDDIYAIVHTITEDTEIYEIPAQKTKSYSINSGCIIYSEDRIVLSIDNKNDCSGVTSDNNTDIKIGKGGVKAGDVNISSSGVSVPGVKIGKDSVEISKNALSGIQYIGEK